MGATDKTPRQLRDAAAKLRQRARESFERCDTDGFLTQWANDLTAQLREREAIVAESGGLAKFVGLYHGERRVRAMTIETSFGRCWKLHRDEVESFAGRRFIPCGARSRIQRAMGLREAQEVAPARAVITGKGHGLSGSAWVAVERSGDKWGQDAKEDVTEDN